MTELQAPHRTLVCGRRLEAARVCQKTGDGIGLTAPGIAGWMHQVTGFNERGRRTAVDDPMEDHFA